MNRFILTIAALALAPISIHAQTTPRLGTVHFPTSGAPNAQPHFIRGILYLHSFEYDSAAKAFREAQRVDPAFALAYWGEAMTYTHPVWFQQDLAAARAVLARFGPDRATRLQRIADVRERRWFETAEVLYGDGGKEKRDTLFAESLRLLAKDYPSDREAQALYALALLGTTHQGRHTPTYMRAAAIVEDVFRDNPDHPGAAHYLIHSYDDPVHAPLGMRAARAYGNIAPGAAHAQHMTSHIFVAAGLWGDVITANVSAWETSNRRNGHYTQWLAYGYQQEGRFADAWRYVQAFRAEAERERTPYAITHYAIMLAQYLVDREDWRGHAGAVALDSATLLTETHEGPGGGPRVGAFALARSLAALKTGRVAIAERSVGNISRRCATARQTSTASYVAGSPHICQVIELTLRGAMHDEAGRRDSAIATLTTAAQIEESLPYEYGPPETVRPPRELLGTVLLSAGQAAEARVAFEQALSRTPNRSRAVLGLARAYAALGDRQQAARWYAQFRANWARVAPNVAEAAEAEKYLATSETGR
ncbi:MAG: tetratricopeptide repeat protein [Gemmatimonadaceae bacterium]